MTRDGRLILLLILLYGLFLVEARHLPHEDTANDARHRHRHRHERKNHQDCSEELEYEHGDEEYDDDDYETRSRVDWIYPPRRHRVGGQRGSEWYDDDDDDYDAKSRIGWIYPPRRHRAGQRGNDERRRGSLRHGYRLKNHRRLGHSRNRDSEYDGSEDEFDYERPRGYNEEHRWKNGRKHRTGVHRHDWRLDGRKGHRPDESSRRHDDWRARSNATDFRSHLKRKNHSEDYEYRADDDDDYEEDWYDEEEEEFDNDFNRSKKKPPLKTYDDIIRRLTSGDLTTPKAVQSARDYRSVAMNGYAKRDGFGNFKYEPKNVSRPFERQSLRKTESLPGKLLVSLIERKSVRNNSDAATKSVDIAEKKVGAKIDDAQQPKTKSLEQQDYDEYVNAPDNEKEEDLIKAGVEEETGMQADVTNTDYTEVDDEEETPVTTSMSKATTTPSTTTTTTTSTTTPRPVVAQNYDYREPKPYEGETGVQYNSYQSKNEYPPMSAHSVHKWQSLGTRESVKETRGNMQQYNKNGKTAEIQEALQHARKVSREGSCQWPRPRVIPVRDVYPSPSTTYIPHCVILHRCSDDTGCCRSEALTCVPKHTHRVELSFYTANVGGGSVVEKLSFYNHTECECRERTEYDTGNEKPSEQRVYRHHQSSPQPQNMRRAQPRKPCRCPSEFTPRITSEGECQCNCFENHQNCVKMRRGKGYFSLVDRLCVQNEECALPNCEFGEYLKWLGKCPLKIDKFDAIANYNKNVSHRRSANRRRT